MKKISKGMIALVVVGILAIWMIIGYNGLVSQEEGVNTEWSNVQTQYQRRSDLIPNLVNTVKGYAKHESETLEKVMAARSKATQLTVDAENLTPEKMQQIQASQGELSSALGRLLAITENYPDLKANQNFSELQAQLEGTENRIAESRRLYNEKVKDYNISIRRFPNNLLAGLFGFEKKMTFEADAAAQQAPTVSF
jgi:LemA protein